MAVLLQGCSLRVQYCIMQKRSHGKDREGRALELGYEKRRCDEKISKKREKQDLGLNA